MFNLWSILNSTITEEEVLLKKLEAHKDSFKLSLNGYYKTPSASPTPQVKDLKKNETELVKKLSETLNLHEELCAEVYREYLNSTFNKFQAGDELLEKIETDELVTVHFDNFVNFYFRERYSFLRNLILITSVVGGKVEEGSDEFISSSNVITKVFKRDDLKVIYKSVVQDYNILCKKIKTSGSGFTKNTLITDSFIQSNLIQTINELELILELMLILVSINKITLDNFYDVSSMFSKISIVKWLNSSKISSQVNSTLIMDQISYLQVLIIVKLTKLDKEVLGDDKSDALTNDEKIKFLSTDTKNSISDIIGSCGSNYTASPIMLACSSLLYSFSIDALVGKVMTKEAKTIMNRMFASAVKENVLNNLLMIFATNLFNNQETWLCVTQVIYDLINSVLHLFDENSLGDNIKALFDICFFCMQKNKSICENYWMLCKQPDRDNLTILMSHSIETFPINLGLTFTFFSLISKISPDLCKQINDYLTHMDQFCEYFEDLDPNEYNSNGDAVKLIRSRKLFDSYFLPDGHQGVIYSSSNSQQNSNTSHKLILHAPAVGWPLIYNCYDLIKTYFQKINYLSENNNLSGEANVFSIIELIDSIFKYFFDIEDQMLESEFEMNTKYMEMFVNSCFTLFSNLMNKEWPDSYRLISKLLSFFNNISSQIYDKLIRLLEQNELIGYNISCEQMTIQQVLSNRHNLIKNLSKLKFIFQSNDKELITNYVKLIDNLIKDNGNNIQYMNPLFCVLVYIFPDVYKWKVNSFDIDIDLSLACLNLFHSVLNTSLSNSVFIQESVNFFPRNTTQTSKFSIDSLCEAILINTECSESLLNLIHVGYEYSNDQNYMNKIKKFDMVLMQGISLINRLIVVPNNMEEIDVTSMQISQSALYLNLIKYINQQQIHLTESSYDNRKPLADANITKNNQFIMQLDLLMSKTGYSNSIKSAFDDKNNTNWFHLLTKIAIFKSNRTIDCLLFSLFKKISQLTPLLFGSLLGPYANQIHMVLLNKINNNSEGQIITILCEFFCSLIENQAAFFHQLADLTKENLKDNEKDKNSDTKTIESDRNILKSLFKLFSKLKKDSQDYYISVSGVYSVFYTIWSNKKVDYMNYCKNKPEFWPMLSNTLHLLKKDVNLASKKSDIPNELDGQNFNEKSATEYLEYFGIENLNYDNGFNEFIIEANIKSVSYALKIYSIQIFEMCYDKTNESEMIAYFNENVFEKNLIEKWLGLFALQIKRDLYDERELIFNTLEIAHDQERIVKADLSIIDINLYNKKNQNKNKTFPVLTGSSKESKSKLLLDSINSLFLLINKITRITSSSSATKIEPFLEKINLKRIKLDLVYNYFIESILEMINHFLVLNNTLLSIQQEQEQVLDYEPVSNKKTKVSSKNHFITLKQSNEIVKQFHSITNVLMISITSIKNIDSSNLLNLKQTINDLITINEKLMVEDFNYFPSIINSVQTSILHIFTVNTNASQIVVDFLKEDEVILKKLFNSMFKIFSMSTNNLENEQDMESSSFHESSNIFILNARILDFLMNRINSEYWVKEMTERCLLQCLYSLFERFIKNQKNSKIVFSVLEMLFTLANKQIEFLVKSDFNSKTCLLIGKLFDHCFSTQENADEKKERELDSIAWSNVLCLYFDIQTILLKSLKQVYLKNSIIFFGSYYETIARIVIDSRQSFDVHFLEIIRTFSRYLVQISKYKRELLINLPNSADYLEQIFCDMLHSCISKTRQIKSVSSRLSQQLHASAQKKDKLTPQQQAASMKSKKEIGKCIAAQNLIFSIMSVSLDALMNYVPNLGDNNYITHFDEYKLLISTQLAQPSSFDNFSAFSFGSILWIIDYCLKIAQKNEICSSSITKQSITTPKKGELHVLATETASPKKGVSSNVEESAIETKFATKQIIMGVLEKFLNFLLTQIVLFEKQSQYSVRDKKIFKRELSSEINSILQGFNKTFKRTASTVQYASKSPTKGSSQNLAALNQSQSYSFISFSSKHTCEFFKFIQTFLQQHMD